MISIKRTTTIIFLTFFLAGCTHMGPKYMPPNRESYNKALQKSSQEQILLNIVRLRYSDTPMFLSVTSIASQIDMQLEIDPQLSFTNSDFTRDIGAKIGYSESPLFSFTPLQDQAFTKKLMTPIRLNTVMMFLNSGWEVKRILRLFYNRIGPLNNAKGFSSPEINVLPHYREFSRFVDQIAALAFQNTISATATITQNAIASQIPTSTKNNKEAKSRVENILPKSTYVVSIKFTGKPEDRPQFELLLKQLKLNTKLNAFKTIQSNKVQISRDTVGISTRSFLDILYFVAKSVNVPQEDIEAGLVSKITNDKGETLDWRRVTKDLIAIHYSYIKPKNAAVAIQYRDKWFYIADNDIISKRTLSALLLLFNLKSGDDSKHQPLYSISF